MQYKVGVLAMYLSGRKLEELSFFRKLCVTGRKLGVEVLVFTPDDVDESGSRVYAMTYDLSEGGWIRKRVRFPRVIYDRCRYHGVENLRKITRFRKTYRRLHYLSRPLANKWTIYQVLCENEAVAPHLPATERYNGPKQLAEFLKKHSIVYLKPRSGTGGRGILRLQRMKGGDFCLLQGRDPNRRILPAQKTAVRDIDSKLTGWRLDDKYIVQQGIPLQLKNGRVHDFRMLVQKDHAGDWQVTGCAGRIGPKQSVTSNLHGGGKAVPMETLLRKRFGSAEKVEEIKNSAYALGLSTVEHLENKFGSFCEAGLDLAVDPTGHVWLLEVNPKPSREVFYRIGDTATYRLAISRPLEYALWLLDEKKQAVKTAAVKSSI